MDGERSLDALRCDIDSIDDAIHDLIIRRTELVEKVRDLKRDTLVKIRPSREAEIVYRLIDRHRGPFPKRELVAIWRQLIVATLGFEGPFRAAVYLPPDGPGFWDLARDHFGIFTPMRRHTSVRSVIEAVHRQDATVGVLPMPQRDDRDPWWRHLVTKQPEAPRIIARLPFAGPGNGIGGNLEALAICPVTLTATGRDRSLFAIETEEHIGLNQLGTILADFGLPPTFAAIWGEEQRPRAFLYLVEIDGFLTNGDPRLTRLEHNLSKTVNRVVPLGGYAKPLTVEDLGPATSNPDPEPAKTRQPASTPAR